MTIVMGLMADSRQSEDASVPTSSYLLLCADTMATYATPGGVTITSHPSQGKIYPLPSGFYAAFCDDYSWSHQIATELNGRMLTVDMSSDAVKDLIKNEIREAFGYAFSWYRDEVLRNEVGITAEEYLHDAKLDPSLRQRADDVLSGAAAQVPAELIVAGQTRRGPALFKANAVGIRETTEFHVSGGPAESAISWLKMRDQRNNMSVPRSAYHMIEAKRFAQLDPTVGQKTQIIFIPPAGSPKEFRDDGNTAMTKWREIFGLKDTDELDGDEARKLFERATGVSLPPMLGVSKT